jgi:thymidylate synthase
VESNIYEIGSFDYMYADALAGVMAAHVSHNRRTNKLVKQVHGLTFKTKTFPIVSLRDIRPLWSCAESVWFMSGSKDPSFMTKYGFNAWDQFKDSDGNVYSATGWRWREGFGVDQLTTVVDRLQWDNSFRQGVLCSWDPRMDCETPGPNAPCLVVWHFQIVDGLLCMSIFQRSADMYFGFPHDILGARLVQELIAARLTIHSGSIFYTIANAHLYEDQWAAAEEMLDRVPRSTLRQEVIDLSLDPVDYLRATAADEKLPLDMMDKIRAFYNPWPSIKGPVLAR